MANDLTTDRHDAGGPRRRDPSLPDRRRRRGVDSTSATTLVLGVAGGLLLAALVGATVTRLRNLMVLVLVSLFLSFAMEPAVQWMHRKGVRRGLGTLLVFVLTGIALAAFAAAMVVAVSDQVRSLVDGAPGLLDEIARRASTSLPEPFGARAADTIREQAQQLPSRLGDVAQSLGEGALGLVGGVVNVLTVLLVTFYLVADGPRLRRTLSGRLAPDRQRELLEVWELAIAKTGGYVYTRLLTAGASALVHVVAFMLLDLEFALPLGLWVGLVSSLIPVVGTYLAGALPVTVALAADPTTALWVAVVLITYQQVENYLVAPRITEQTLELHPAVAFLSVLAGAALLGAAGALLALPVAAIATALVSTYGERHEVLDHGLTAEHPPGRADQVEWLVPRTRSGAAAAVPGNGGAGPTASAAAARTAATRSDVGEPAGGATTKVER